MGALAPQKATEGSFMTARPDFNHRPSAQHTPSFMDLHRDPSPARRCAKCDRHAIRVSPGGLCRTCCDNGQYKSSDGRSIIGNLAAIRAGTWTPTAALATVLAAHNEEVAACAVCGCVRVKTVGWPCNGCISGEHQGRETTAQAQGALFGVTT